MNMTEFRQSEELVAEARKLMNRPVWKVLCEVMRSEHPMHGISKEVLPPQTDSRMLGMIDGYNYFEAILSQAKEPLKPTVPLQSTFQPPEPETE